MLSGRIKSHLSMTLNIYKYFLLKFAVKTALPQGHVYTVVEAFKLSCVLCVMYIIIYMLLHNVRLSIVIM